MLVIAVGSSNPVKIKGIKKAFSHYIREFKLYSISVDNCVGSQPWGYGEIFKGAWCRSINALKKIDGADYGVGLEAGVVRHGDRYYILQVCCIISSDGDSAFGLSPGFEAPKEVVEPIIKGIFDELEGAVESITEAKRVGEREGLVGIMSKGLVKRVDLSYYATLMALIRLFRRSFGSK